MYIIIVSDEATMDHRDRQMSALKSLGYCVRAYSPWFAAIERNRLNPSDADYLRFYIDGLAEKLEHLAEIVPEGTVTYSQIEAILKDLYDVGFYPAKLAIRTVLHAFADENTTQRSQAIAQQSTKQSPQKAHTAREQ
jgi:hypothetical protein